MKNGIALLILGLSLCGCSGGPLFPLASTYPWRCVMRDGKGDLFFGIDEGRQSAIDEAQRQCLAGSALRPTCKAENVYCEQLPPID